MDSHEATAIEDRFWRDYHLYKGKELSYRERIELLLFDWKSQKERGMNSYRNRITQEMNKSLKILLCNERPKIKKATLHALEKRNLVNEFGELTEHGKVLALRQLPLNDQCRFLNIQLEEWKIRWESKPEDIVMNTLIQQGSKAYFIENTFGLFIDYILGDYTISLAQSLNKTVYTLNLPYDPELFFWAKRSLDRYIQSLINTHCWDTFNTCLPFLERIIMDIKPFDLVDMFNNIYQSLGMERIKSLLYMYFSNPLAYNYRGWPDIIVLKFEAPYFIEVKTTDKLHINQLVTIPDLINFTGIQVKIAQLTNGENIFLGK